MNPTDTAAPPQPYTCPALQTLARIVAAADLKAASAEAILTQRAKARVGVSDAEAIFLDSLSDRAAADLSNAKRRLQDLEFSAAAIEDAGGVAGVRYRALHVAATFTALAAGYADRVEELGRQMPKALKLLSAARSTATEGGFHTVAIEFLHEVQVARGLVETIVAARQDATALREYCQRWTPSLRMNKTFNDLLGTLESPLP